MCQKCYQSVQRVDSPHRPTWNISFFGYFTLPYLALHYLILPVPFSMRNSTDRTGQPIWTPTGSKTPSSGRKCLWGWHIPNHGKGPKSPKLPFLISLGISSQIKKSNNLWTVRETKIFNGVGLLIEIRGMQSNRNGETDSSPLRPVENLLIIHKRFKKEGICLLDTNKKPLSPDKMATSFWCVYSHKGQYRHYCQLKICL